MAKFIKKPVEAVQLKWETWDEMCAHAGVGRLTEGKPEGCYVDDDGNEVKDSGARIGLLIPTLEGLMTAREDDWIIKDIQGDIYLCKPDIFEATYTPVEEGESRG